MIPAAIHHQRASGGEREVFRRLRDDPTTAGWVVLHSLDIANHVRQVSGEADFVVIVPHLGVLCLEIKGCSRLRRADGKWYYGNDPDPDARGPFRQASEAMHSMRKRLVRADPSLSRVVFWSAVVFPYVTFNAASGEWHDWQVIDRQSFTARPLGASLRSALERARAHISASVTGGWFDPGLALPSAQQCERIASLLRADFEFIESSKTRGDRLDRELKHYTAEQYLALDALENNPRIAFTGLAGTGKTLLAVEAARRGRAAGRRILFLCFNRLLGKWLESQTSALQPEVVTRTLHRHMLKVAGTSLPATPRDGFWEEELPLLAMEKLVDDAGEGNIFDELIIDEAQDVMRPSYLDFLDLSLRGGLASGRWRMFGDFEKQNIYGTAGTSLEEALRERAGAVPVYSLQVNCRNPPRIAETAQLLGGLEARYARVLRPDNRLEPKINYYHDEASQQALLVDALQDLWREGYRAGDIIVLSTRSDAASAASMVNVSPWKERLRPAHLAGSGHIPYSSVHAFKGMEAAAVIVTDINTISGAAPASLFYVAVTRAVDKLVMLAHDAARNEVIAALS